MNKVFQRLIMAVSIAMYANVSSGADEKEEKVEEGDAPAVFERPIYVPVKPAFVVNYGGTGKLKYLKLGVSLRVIDTAASNAARHHMPLIRDYLVTLLSGQKDENVDTTEAKERLRLTALKGVQDLLLEEDGEQGVTNLFFTDFIVQR